MKWDQKKITEWSVNTFGITDFISVAHRMRWEISEFYECIDQDDIENAKKEIADIEIMLRQVAEMLGVDLDEAVDKKMDINEKRKWERGTDGHYQHVDT